MIANWPEGKFDVILADPPWKYRDLGHSRRVDRIYPLMQLENICALPVSELAAENCALFLWTTSPMLMTEAPAVIGAWGFTYKSSCIWDKEIAGMGHYWRIRHEFILLATRGRPGIFADHTMQSVIRSRRGKHSVKPGVVYYQIERAYPTARKIELFATRPRAGWTSWGLGLDTHTQNPEEQNATGHR